MLILITGSLLAGQVCFGTLELLDFLGRGCISLGEYIDGVHTYFQVITDVFLLKLSLCALDASSFQENVNILLPFILDA